MTITWKIFHAGHAETSVHFAKLHVAKCHAAKWKTPGNRALAVFLFLLLATAAFAQNIPHTSTAISGADAATDTRANLRLDPAVLATPSMRLPERQSDLGRQPLDPGTTLDEGQAADLASSFITDRIIDIFQQQPELIGPVKASIIKRLEAVGLSDRAQALATDTTDDAFLRRIQEDPDLRLMIIDELRQRGFARDATSEGDDIEPDSSRALSKNAEDAIPIALQNHIARSSPLAKGWTKGQLPQDEPEQYAALRRPSPYPTLPSMRDLYSQIPSKESKLRRFGSDIFRNGSGNIDQLPIDLPVGPDYVLGTGDGLTLNLSGSVSRRLARTVDRQGEIELPEAGTVVVAGRSISEAQRLIEETLAPQFHKISVEISLARLRTVRIYVVGDVQRPGAYDVSALSTPFNALYSAGGPTNHGSLRTIRHLRGDRLVREVDLYDFLLRGVTSASMDRLQSGDTIVVPPIGPQVTLRGMLRRPAIYELRNEKNLNEVIELAGGVLVSGMFRQITVERVEAHKGRTMLSVEAPDSDDKAALDKALDSFVVQDGDEILVAPIPPYSNQTVYLQGHVVRPGKYPYHDGITVNELLRSYADLLPEPADHAEIVRLQPPDFRPDTIDFSLKDILAGDDPIRLAAFDTIRVYSRYEIDPPNAYVYGEVLRPGEYPLSSAMTAAGLIRMAGGFNRSADREDADLTSYVVKDGQKIVSSARVISISKALSGDALADVVLKPGDVLMVRQLVGWSDIGASVSVKGEVEHPGIYGIHEGERLSSLLERAGGFRDGAYPAGAILERKQVRELSEKSRQELIRRIETAGASVKVGVHTGGQEALSVLQVMQQQQQQVLASLRSHPASGRQVIKISSDISSWANTPADIELRAGDVLTVPRRPNFVLVNGQVFSPVAVTFIPGKNAEWYLKQAGGPTQLGNKKAIFVVRADGSVVGNGNSWWSGSVLDLRMQPGDSVVVPDRIVGGSEFWKNLLTSGQMASSAAITALAVSRF